MDIVFQGSFVVSSNPFGRFFLQTWRLSLLCWIYEWGPLQIFRVLALCSYLLSGTVSVTLATLFSLESLQCLFSIRAHVLPVPGNSLRILSWAHPACFPSLRDHRPVLPGVQCLENHCFKYFCLGFLCLCFRKEGTSRNKSQLIWF